MFYTDLTTLKETTYRFSCVLHQGPFQGPFCPSNERTPAPSSGYPQKKTSGCGTIFVLDQFYRTSLLRSLGSSDTPFVGGHRSVE